MFWGREPENFNPEIIHFRLYVASKPVSIMLKMKSIQPARAKIQKMPYLLLGFSVNLVY